MDGGAWETGKRGGRSSVVHVPRVCAYTKAMLWYIVRIYVRI
jgi:hypothetical protein